MVTALTADRRILRQWNLHLDPEQRVPLPEGTSSVHLTDPDRQTRVRIEPGTPRLGDHHA
ncbi:hypothetical protein [Pseudonocardia sp. HH130630-07]|uniref:hypothetical protein n=1 Tax=Pseudonocardia sp. HH130630-07 TaxID=1690815 RepID=UPI000814C153|nr:hypothetical protein [Pseudonocardia sp. HH130630-07]ANY05906.1 hypothetical protein AFB00_05870 [Pseudonocardia sp. HH130630-07]